MKHQTKSCGKTISALYFVAGFFLGSTAASAADQVLCRDIARKYEARRGEFTSLEVNNSLFVAAEKSCDALIAMVLDDGASLEARDREGNRALARAARAGATIVVRLLLARGAEVDARNIAGSTALYLAAEKDKTQVIGVLINAGANVDLPGRSGVRPRKEAGNEKHDHQNYNYYESDSHDFRTSSLHPRRL